MNKYNDSFITDNNKIYLNSASTSYICKNAYEKMNEYYKSFGANTGRGIDSLGYSVTKKIEDVREDVAQFLNAGTDEIIFTRGATESLNIVALSLGDLIIKEDDEIIISICEHHSNFVSWQELAKRKKAKLIVIGIDKNNNVALSELKAKLNEKTKIVALNHSSNVLGAINSLKEISEIVHEYNAYLVVDGTQGILHEKVDVKKLNIDFYAFSSHKIYGPKGVGILYGKSSILNEMKPVIFGGEMVNLVGLDNTTYKKAPYKFEAGTMMIPEIIGLGGAIEYISSIGIENINQHLESLRNYTIKHMKEKYDNIIYYNENNRGNIISFNVKDIHSHDVASVLDKHNIIVRAGHHCCEPLMNYLKIPSTIRVSFGLYNTEADCDKFIQALGKVSDYLDVLFR